MKSTILKLLSFLAITLSLNFNSYGNELPTTSLDPKQIIQDALTNVVENMNLSEKTISKYFSTDYKQYVDGKFLNYNDFISHMIKQKSLLSSAKVTIKQIIVEKNKVSTIHIVDAIKKDGGVVKVQVNAFYILKNNKIILVDELTHVINGEKSDKDLGSSK